MRPLYRYVLAVLVIAALVQPAMARAAAYEFQLDENAKAEDAADALPAGEIDPNAAGAAEAIAKSEAADGAGAVEAPTSDKAKESDVDKPAQVAATPEKAAAKPSAEALAEKPVAAKAPQPEEIPLIETHNDVVSHPDVTFVTGGIGADEQEAIQAAKADYNLHIMSASINGAFVGDARVVITRGKDKNREVMLSVVSGPLLYVRLPEGAYALEATLGEQVKRQNFTVSKKGVAANIHLGWKVDAVVAK